MLNIDLKNKPDFVFALFSGINRVDTVVPNSDIVKTAVIKGDKGGNVLGCNSSVIGSSAYIFSGGSRYNKLINDNYKNINHNDWPNVKSIEEFLNLSSEQKQACINLSFPDIFQRYREAIPYETTIKNKKTTLLLMWFFEVGRMALESPRPSRLKRDILPS